MSFSSVPRDQSGGEAVAAGREKMAEADGEEVEVAVKVPPEFAPKAYGEISAFGRLTREAWQNNGAWIGVVQIPAGMQTEFYDLVNRLTKGEAETKLLKH